jgi:hypothetical protein
MRSSLGNKYSRGDAGADANRADDRNARTMLAFCDPIG